MCRSQRNTMLCPSYRRGQTEDGSGRGEAKVRAGSSPPAHLNHVHASLQPGRALKVPCAPQVLVAEKRGQGVSAGDRKGCSPEGDRDHQQGEGTFSGRGSGAYNSCRRFPQGGGGGFCIPVSATWETSLNPQKGGGGEGQRGRDPCLAGEGAGRLREHHQDGRSHHEEPRRHPSAASGGTGGLTGAVGRLVGLSRRPCHRCQSLPG